MRRLAAAVLALLAALVATFIARPYVHGLSFVFRAADIHGKLRTVADLGISAVGEREIAIPTPGGPLRARVYAPIRSARRAVLLVSGLHSSGIDEPRLVRFARDLSADRVVVVTPDIKELSRFEISPAITDTIEHVAAWLASEPTLSPDGRVGLMGISFSGGLAMVAAGRPSLNGRLAYVFSFGGYDDLPRVLRYLCTGTEPYPPSRFQLKPDTTGNTQVFERPPHDYGVAIVLLGVAERLVPRAQVEALRLAVRRYLFASALDSIDKVQGGREFTAVRSLIRTLPEPSATLLRYIVDRDVVHLGPRLLPFVAFYGGDPGLSLSKSPKPTAPAFILHGIDDNVIPSIESEYLAEDLRGHAPVRLLLSDLITHAEADQPPRFGNIMELAGFWGDLLER